MNTINSIIIEGNLVRDPVLKITPNGSEVCNFSLASNRNYMRNNEKITEVSFFDIEAWSEIAKHCSSDGRKGKAARVVGRLKQDRWKGSDGKNYSRIKIIADNVAFKPEKNKPSDESNTLKKAELKQEEIAELVTF